MTESELVSFAMSVTGEGASALPGYMLYSPAELGVLARAALSIPYGGSALEVGVYVGRSGSILFNLQAEKDLDITLVDAWGWNVPLSRQSFDNLIREKFPVTPFSAYWMMSDRAAPMVRKQFDYIHIDGDHNEDPVRNDIHNWVLGKLKPGGVACFHDYDGEGVRIPVDELLAGWPREQAERTIALRRPACPGTLSRYLHELDQETV